MSSVKIIKLPTGSFIARLTNPTIVIVFEPVIVLLRIQ